MKIFSNVVSRLLGFAVVVGLVGGFATAQAQSEASYSSGARTSGWAFGYGVGYSSRHNADVTALNVCHAQGKGQCHIVHRFRGAGCIALAKGSNGAGGMGLVNGYSNNRSAAQNRALNECNSRGGSCYITSTGCTTN